MLASEYAALQLATSLWETRESGFQSAWPESDIPSPAFKFEIACWELVLFAALLHRRRCKIDVYFPEAIQWQERRFPQPLATQELRGKRSRCDMAEAGTLLPARCNGRILASSSFLESLSVMCCDVLLL